MIRRERPLVLFSLAVLSAITCGGLLVACKKDPPPKPAVQKIHKCYFTDLAFDGPGAASVKATVRWEGEPSARPVGSFQLHVLHSEPPDPAKRSALPPSTAVCQINGELTAASYTGDTSSTEASVRGETAVIHGKLEAPCPTTAPDNRIVTAFASVKLDGEDVGNCANWGFVPAAIGGDNLTEDDQAKASFVRAAQKKHPAEMAMVTTYTTSLLTAASKIDPAAAAPADRALRSCPPDVKGEVPSFGYTSLLRLSSRSRKGPAFMPDTKVQTDAPAMINASNLIEELDPDATAEKIVIAAAHLKNAPRHAIVFTTLEVTHPTYDLPEAPKGYPRQGTLMPGSYGGVIYVVDREAGKISCAAPFAMKSKTREIKEKTQDLARVVQERFSFEITERMRDTLRVMAPGLTAAR